MADAQAPRNNPTEPLPADEEQRRAGQPAAAGLGPGRGPTGLRQPQGWPINLGGVEGVESGGTLPVGASGGSGTGFGGLGSGLAGTGGMQNLPHGAGRPAHTTPTGESGQPEIGATAEGVHYQGHPDTTVTPDLQDDAVSSAEFGETSTRSGDGGVEPGNTPTNPVRGAGSGRV